MYRPEQIAAAVADELEGGLWSLMPLAILRGYRPSYDKAPEQVQLFVLPTAERRAILDRLADRIEVDVDVGVLARCEAADVERADALMGLAAEIARHFNRRELEGLPEARWRRTAREPLYDPRQLGENHLFIAIIRLTYEELSA